MLGDKLAQLQVQDKTAIGAQIQRHVAEKTATQGQRQTLQQSLQAVQSLTPMLREKGLEVIQRERQNLRQRLQNLHELQPALKQRWNERQKLSLQGAVPKDMALQARQEYINVQAQINEAQSQLNQLDVKEADTLAQYLRNVNQVKELQAQLKALDSRTATQAEQDLTIATNRQKEIQETERQIAQLQLQLLRSSQIVSDYTGRILEITAKPGQQLEPGMGTGAIAAQDASAKLVNVAFLPVSEGKKIKLVVKRKLHPPSLSVKNLVALKQK